eukprot:158191_1
MLDYTATVQNFWVGLHKVNNEWEWQDGTIYEESYPFWGYGEPDRGICDQSFCNCGKIKPYPHIVVYFESYSCIYKWSFFCNQPNILNGDGMSETLIIRQLHVMGDEEDYFNQTILESTGLENEYDLRQDVYSIVGNINVGTYKASNGYFYFKLIYGYNGQYAEDIIIWRQLSWITSHTINGYDAIKVNDNYIGDLCLGFYGVRKNIINSNMSWLTASDTFCSWNLIATFNHFNGTFPMGIPAFNGKFANSAKLYICSGVYDEHGHCNGRQYYKVEQVLNYTNAEAYCREMYGTDLAGIETEQDAMRILSMYTPTNSYYVGLNHLNDESIWKWIDDTVCIEGSCDQSRFWNSNLSNLNNGNCAAVTTTNIGDGILDPVDCNGYTVNGFFCNRNISHHGNELCFTNAWDVVTGNWSFDKSQCILRNIAHKTDEIDIVLFDTNYDSSSFTFKAMIEIHSCCKAGILFRGSVTTNITKYFWIDLDVESQTIAFGKLSTHQETEK